MCWRKHCEQHAWVLALGFGRLSCLHLVLKQTCSRDQQIRTQRSESHFRLVARCLRPLRVLLPLQLKLPQLPPTPFHLRQKATARQADPLPAGASQAKEGPYHRTHSIKVAVMPVYEAKISLVAER